MDSYLIDDVWLRRRPEPILMPDLPIIDPHHHLWPEAKYGLPDILADLRVGHKMVATVYIEAWHGYRDSGPDHLRPIGETEFAVGIAEQCEREGPETPRVCAGIVGSADLLLGEAVDEVLIGHVVAGGGRFRGIRGIAYWTPVGISLGKSSPPRGLLLDKEFRKGFSRLAKHGLTYDAMQYFIQLPELEDLAQAFPGTTIIVNHFGAPLGAEPYVGSEVFPEWKRLIENLGRCPNVYMKLGGFGSQRNEFRIPHDTLPPSSAELAEIYRPYVEVCIESFGAKRCMFESNFPPMKQSYSYAAIWNAYKILAADASEGERRYLFHDTANEVYRLGL